MELKLFDSERKVMEVLWDHGDLSAKELADPPEGAGGLEQNYHLYRDQKVH